MNGQFTVYLLLILNVRDILYCLESVLQNRWDMNPRRQDRNLLCHHGASPVLYTWKKFFILLTS